MPAFLSAEGLSKLLQKIKTVFATKTELTTLEYSLTAQANQLGTTFVHKTGNETISGTKTFSSTIAGSVSGSAGKIVGTPAGTTWVAGCTSPNALINASTTGYGAIWNAPTKDYRVSCSTYPSTDNLVRLLSITNANVSAGTNTTAKTLSWNADNGTLTANTFSGAYTGGTIAIANGGTGATTRLKGLQALTNENVGTGAQYFLTITSNWGKGGYSSTANAKTVLGISGSDRRIKDDIEEIPDEILDAWENVKWNQFRMKKEVRQNGSDAPIHFGSVVQDVQNALSDGGVDPSRYGFLYHEDYLPEERDLPSEENPEITNGEKWYLKYAEALSIEAAYLRRRCQNLEKRIAALEAKGE